jgi:DME family drug/metabolite transporter
VATVRALLVLVGVTAICRVTGRRLRLPLRTWRHCAGLGVLMSMMAYGNIAAVQYIPVGLTALLFYTFPPIVALIGVTVLGERPSASKVVALVVAFAGLALMLGVSLERVDLRGMALALGAGVSTAWHAVWLARKVAFVDPLVLTFHMACVAALILGCALALAGGPTMPVTARGWAAGLAVVGLQATALPVYFAAIARVGALKCSMVANVQPVASIVAAYFLYAEVLGRAQLAGGACVLGGIALMQWSDARRR